MSSFARCLIAGAALLLAGCAPRPDMGLPEFQGPLSYTSAGLPDSTEGASVETGRPQTFNSGGDVSSQWWTLFESKALQEVIEQALNQNPSLQSAQARLKEARELWKARGGQINYPQINGTLNASRMKTGPAALGLDNGSSSIFNLYNASVDVSYTFDLFGAGRRELASLKAVVDFEQFQYQAATTSLVSNIVATAITEASLREQIGALEDITASQERELDLLEKQFQIGGVARSSVLTQRSRLEQTRAQLPAMRNSLLATRHQLAVLVGKFPSDETDLPQFTLRELKLPEDLPVSLPSMLARQRPDVRASEALLRAANERAGIATANLYPQITLTGSYGPQATKWNDLLDLDRTVWNVGAGLVQPIFNGGTLRARQRAAMAAREQAAAGFREVVLTAFQQVADTLKSLEADALVLKAQVDAEDAASESYDLAKRQLEAGAVGYLFLLESERQYQESKIKRIQAQAARLSHTAALFQALGGGWWNRTDNAGIVGK